MSAASGSRAGGGGSFSGRGSGGRNAEADLLRRVPPHSAEAEQAVLSGVLMRPDALHIIVDILSAEDF